MPQGSVLEPILFLLYINDLPNGISSVVRLFADDAIVYREVLTVSNKRSPIETDYFLHGQALKNVKSAKYLGLTINKDLEWDSHPH